MPWESVRLQITAWAPPVLLILGVITLVITLRTWRERRRTIDLQVAWRARKVQLSLDLWLRDPALRLVPGDLPAQWRQRDSWTEVGVLLVRDGSRNIKGTLRI